MASVTDYELQAIARDIVTEFKHGSTLNDLVTKKASAAGFNKDQTERLIERTNSEAFLSLYPTTTEFEVADPNIILSKTASYKEDSAVEFKKEAASRVEIPSRGSYKDYLSQGFDSIFGMDSTEKTASYETEGDKDITQLAMKLASEKAEDKVRIDKVAARLHIEHGFNNVWKLYKEAALQGRSTEDLESEILGALSTSGHKKLASDLVESLNDKLGKQTHLDSRSFKRASTTEDNYGIYNETSLTRAFKGLVGAVDRGREIL